MALVVVLLRIDAADVLRDMIRAEKSNEFEETAFISPIDAFVRKLLLRKLSISQWSTIKQAFCQ